ncbi:MAG: helix-hairpin-helix domain-containing protein [Candidatus Marsarchaeota archaeon]|nr:helix-hairpin-helix domain-containing protein [Candidatus Marsarchaeota archaeon]
MGEVKIIVDKRERNLDILEGLSGSGILLNFAQLPVGDYILSDRMCVERKTVHDLENSIINTRLFDQVDRLNNTYKKPILLIEGEESEFTMNPNVVLGAIISVYSDYNVQVIRSKDTADTVSTLARLAEREQEEKREPRMLGSKRAFSDSQWQILILSSIPGVGPKLARALIRHFRTIKGVIDAEPDKLTEVDKIGKKKAEKIYEILNAKFSEEER